MKKLFGYFDAILVFIFIFLGYCLATVPKEKIGDIIVGLIIAIILKILLSTSEIFIDWGK